MTGERETLTKKFTEADTKAAALQKNIDTLNATNKTQADQITQKDTTITQLTTEKSTLNSKFITAQAELTSKIKDATNLQNQVNQLTEERHNLQTKWDNIPSFQVLSVTWGPKQIANNPQVVAKIEDFAKNKGRTLSWTNDYFGIGDPDPKQGKWGSVIWYFKDDDGLGITRLDGREGNSINLT